MAAAGGEAYDQRALRELFDACDPTRSGFISKASLLQGSKRLGIEDLTDDKVDQMFAKLDDSADGRVSFECFRRHFTEWSQQAVSGSERSESEDPVLESDHRRLIELYEVDPTGVSLHRFLVSDWQWPRSAADQAVQSLNPSMTSDAVSRVLKSFLIEDASPKFPRAHSIHASSVDSGLELLSSPARSSRSNSAPCSAVSARQVSAVRGEESRGTLSNHSGTESDLDTQFPSLKG